MNNIILFMKKAIILLLTVITLIHGLATVNMEKCSSVFVVPMNQKVNHYCPVSTLSIASMTFLDYLQNGLNGVVVFFIINLIVLGVLLKKRIVDKLFIRECLVRRINARQRAMCLWINKFGTGFANNCYM